MDVVDVAGVLQRRPAVRLGPHGRVGVAPCSASQTSALVADRVGQVGDGDGRGVEAALRARPLEDPGPVLGVGRDDRRRRSSWRASSQARADRLHPNGQSEGMQIRAATEDDLLEVSAIYDHHARSSARRSTTSRPGRTAGPPRSATSHAAGEHLLVVVAEDGEVRGYAESSVYRDRPAYEQTREVAVYLGLDAQQQGFGRRLYDDLLGRLRADGIHVAVAVIALPNDGQRARCTARAGSPRPACCARWAGSSRPGSTRRYWWLRLGEETPAS